MFDRTHRSVTCYVLLFVASAAILVNLAGCHKQPVPKEAGPQTFASPEDARKALAAAAKVRGQGRNSGCIRPGSREILSSGDAARDKAAMEGFTRAYDVMDRWRKLADGSELLLVGAQNEVFPVPLMKNSAGQWYFDIAAGKEEIEARRIGRNELAVIDICAALADSQHQYFSQKHNGMSQYAQKFISDPGQQNGLYWDSPASAPRSPLGPLVAVATDEGLRLKPDTAQPYYGYYFRSLERQGPDAEGGAKSYLVSGKMTAGFAYVAYPAKYDDTGIKTFIVDQDGVVYEANLGKDTTNVAKAMTDFNPDKNWTAVQ